MSKKKSMSLVLSLGLILMVSTVLIISCGEPSVESNSFVITFDSQEGTTASPTAKSVIFGSTYGDLPTVEREGYAFVGWWTGTDNESTKIMSSSEVTVTGNQTLYAKWMATGVGLMGPSGGYVFYDKGSYGDDGWRYLEASPSNILIGDSDDTHIFGYYRTSSTGSSELVGTSTGIGTGQANTTALVTAMGSTAYVVETSFSLETKADYAAMVCFEYSVENEETTYDDWFLPSKDELSSMYVNLKTEDVGNIPGDYYLSSSEYSESNVWGQYFFDGGSDYVFKGSSYMVRAVRAF
jgi:uncharacterized repeat protein (TIGR02543 family)